jgi:hypothetical protein
VGRFEVGALASEDGTQHLGLLIMPMVKNVGQTPAIAVTAISVTRKSPTLAHERDIEQSSDRSRSGTILGPNTENGATPSKLKWNELQDVVLGRMTIVIHVYVEYRDFFGDSPVRRTSSCHRVVVLPNFRDNPKPFLFEAGPPDHQHAD